MNEYKVQINLVVSVNMEEKREFYRNLDPKAMGNEKDCWRTLKSLFSDKVKNTSTSIALFEDGSTVKKAMK